MEMEMEMEAGRNASEGWEVNKVQEERIWERTAPERDHQQQQHQSPFQPCHKETTIHLGALIQNYSPVDCLLSSATAISDPTMRWNLV